MSKLIFDEIEILEKDSLYYSLTSRGLYLGESPFTSLLFEDGFLFLNEHMDRLKSMAEFLWEVDWHVLRKKIEKSLAGLCLQERSYVRITFFQDEQEKVHYIIQAKNLPKIPASPLKIALAKGVRFPSLLPSYMKIGNYLESIVERKMVKERGFDDVIYLDNSGLLAEAATSNIFFRVGNTVNTPKINGCQLDGILRRKLVQFLKGEGKEVKVGSFSLDEFNMADEVWLTNGVREIIPVQYFENREFDLKSGWFSEIYDKFNEWKISGRVEL